jgi:hypothetical protein
MSKWFYGLMMCLYLCFQATLSQAVVYSNGTLLSDVTITLDGSLSDWSSSCLVATDGNEFGGGAFDLKDVYMANDSTYLYLAFTRYTVADLPDNGNSYLYLAIDGDNSSSTGSSYDGPGNLDMSGASMVAMFHMTINDKLTTLNVTDGAGGWTDMLSGTGFTYSASSTVVEVRIPLSEIANYTSGGTISLEAAQSYQGDTIVGTHWNAGVTPLTYSLVLPDESETRIYSNGLWLDQLSITIDGNMTDWSDSMVVATDGDETSVFPSYVDLKKVYMANDDSNLYIRYTTQGNTITNITNGGFLILIDADNNASTGINYDGGGNFDMSGVEVMAEVYLANNAEDSTVFIKTSDGAGGWTDATPTRLWHRTDSLTGTELCIPLVTLGITQNTTMRWASVESNWGDTLPGVTWNQALSSSTYFVKFPDSNGWWLNVSRGQRILIDKGLQIEALDVPILRDTYTQVGLNLSRFAESNFTTANLNYTNRGVIFLGDAPGIPWGILSDYGDPEYIVYDVEVPYISNLISYQWRDEQDLTNMSEVTAAKTHFDLVRNSFPDVLCYTNQYGSQTSSTALKSYMQTAKPDLLMFDVYPFTGSVPGGSPTNLYGSMEKYRELGLLGNDGSRSQPIPTGLWLQTYTGEGSAGTHVASDSEMRLNQFSAWAFGFKFAIAFTYTKHFANNDTINSTLFDGVGDSTPTTAFYQIAETNRQSRNLGPALVRLLSKDIRMIMGQHSSSGTYNTVPGGVTAGLSNADDYLTGASATNLGSCNNGLPGDVIVGFFKPLHESFDGDDYSNQMYLMVVNGLSDGTGTGVETKQKIRLTFSGVTSLQRLSRNTGKIETVPLTSNGDGTYYLDLILDGGTGDLFKYNTGAPFVGVTDTAVVGDLNGDGKVNATDIDLLYKAIKAGSGDSTYDLNFDGAVTTADVDYLVEDILDTYYGDADLNGAVGVSDLSLLAAYYNTASGASWANGDFDGNGAVGVSDLSILAANYNSGSSSTLSWADAYAQAFGTTSDAETSSDEATADEEDTSSTICSSLGLSLIAGLALMGLMIVKLEE